MELRLVCTRSNYRPSRPNLDHKQRNRLLDCLLQLRLLLRPKFRVHHEQSERGNIAYFYDGGKIIQERNADTNNLLAHYSSAGRPLSRTTPAGARFYHQDALGSTVNLTDSQTGAVESSYSLDPWGMLRDPIEPGDDNRQIFTGQEHDLNTGLIYFGARYYDPDIGRFITQDPYLGEIDVPVSLHPYLYANSNPMVYIDEDGNIAILREGADTLSTFKGWLRDQTATYQDAGVIGKLGSIATGTSRAVVGLGEFGLRGANYAANWGSMAVANVLNADDAEWAQEHAQEIMGTHATVIGVGSYLLSGGGVGELAEKGFNTVVNAARGDVTAIGDVSEVVSSLLMFKAGNKPVTLSGITGGVTRTAIRTGNAIKTAAGVTRRMLSSASLSTGKTAIKRIASASFSAARSSVRRTFSAPRGAAAKAEKLSAIRQAYNDHIPRWSRYVETMRARGVSAEHIARRVSKARRVAGFRYKKMTPWLERMKIYYWNRAPKWFPKAKIAGEWVPPRNYDSIYGPSIDYLRTIRMKSWDEIIDSALRPNRNLNKALGVK